MRLPVNNAVLTSEYGWRPNPIPGQTGMQFHDGRDYACERHTNQSVLAMWDGKVVADMDNYEDAKRWTDLRHSIGNFLIIQSNVKGTEVFIRYCHLGKNYCYFGQEVPEGYIIGAYADVGQSYGPHIHVDAYLASNWQKISIKELMEG